MAGLQPIGLFDSGIGGLSVWQEVARCLPHEPTIYVADSAYCPYGSRPAAQIIERALTIGRFLVEQGSKVLVVACNTASAAALDALRAGFDLPVVGMEPAVKPAARATRTGHVGVLATAGTIQGALFQNTSRRYANGVQVHMQTGEGLVEQVEAGLLDSPDTAALLHQYLEPMLAAGADQIVLGCTHYPLLMPLIRRIVNGRAAIIDPAQAVARQVARVLQQHSLVAAQNGIPRYRFYTTGPPHTFTFAPGDLPYPAKQTIHFKAVTL